MKKIAWVVLALSTFLCGYPNSQSYGADTVEDKGTAPIILDSYATNVVRPGRTWKIYLRAIDNDGDMKDIFTVFMKVGNTPFLISVTRVDNQDRKELAGYLYLRIPAERDLLFRHFNFQVSVRDHIISTVGRNLVVFNNYRTKISRFVRGDRKTDFLRVHQIWFFETIVCAEKPPIINLTCRGNICVLS